MSRLEKYSVHGGHARDLALGFKVGRTEQAVSTHAGSPSSACSPST